jgi:hypothetical protein
MPVGSGLPTRIHWKKVMYTRRGPLEARGRKVRNIQERKESNIMRIRMRQMRPLGSRGTIRHGPAEYAWKRSCRLLSLLLEEFLNTTPSSKCQIRLFRPIIRAVDTALQMSRIPKIRTRRMLTRMEACGSSVWKKEFLGMSHLQVSIPSGKNEMES